MDIFKEKTILVTGGAGSIGSAILRNLAKSGATQIRVLDINENAMFHLQNKFEHDKRFRFLIGDVRSRQRVDLAMRGVDIVFHAAAIKHVPLSEYNPSEAILTNVIGTENIVLSAIEHNVEKVINISTDKAVSPSNVMGATKLLAEKLVLAAHYSYKGPAKTAFGVIRFGNVLETNGSVIPLWKEQIKTKNEITLTDPEMTRFFMSVEEAVSLVVKAAELTTSSQIFVLKMDAIRIGDLSKAVVEKYGDGNTKIRTIGIRPTEKLHEILLNSHEIAYVNEMDRMYIINYDKLKPTGKTGFVDEMSSEKVRRLTIEEIKKII